MKNINIVTYKIHGINFFFFSLIQIFKKRKTNFSIYFKGKEKVIKKITVNTIDQWNVLSRPIRRNRLSLR